MGLPSSQDLLTMDYGLNGKPAVLVPTTNLVDTFTMDYGKDGQPFVVNPSLAGPSNIAGFDGVTSTNLKTIMGVSYVNLETIMGVT